MAEKRMDAVKRRFSRFMSEQQPDVRKAVGEFISKRVASACNAGIRMGLAAGLHQPELAEEGESEVCPKRREC